MKRGVAVVPTGSRGGRLGHAAGVWLGVVVVLLRVCKAPAEGKGALGCSSISGRV